MVDKEGCKGLYAELKRDMADLENINFRGLWFFRLGLLHENGCWWHYKVLKRQSREYLEGRGLYPLGYDYVLREYKKQ